MNPEIATEFRLIESPLSSRQIEIRNVRVNNLKGIDLDIPHGQWISICGLSGSGKSSLALDTLYAEGQRRYMESLSPYTRQFLQQLDKPDADRIDGIPPAVAVQQRRGKSGPRANVGSLTETNDFLQLLFSQIGKVVCANCNIPVEADSPASVLKKISGAGEGVKYQIGFEINEADQDQVLYQLATAKRNGFGRAITGEHTIDLRQELPREVGSDQTVRVIVDRLTDTSSDRRILESIESAFHFGEGQSCAIFNKSIENGKQVTIDGSDWWVSNFNKTTICSNCQTAYPTPEPRNFNSSSAIGACRKCEGLGTIGRLDMDLIVPDPSRTIEEGAIEPWNTSTYKRHLEKLLALAGEYDIATNIPFVELDDTQRRLVWDGVPGKKFVGLDGFFASLNKSAAKSSATDFLNRWRSNDPCPVCNGDKLNEAGRCFQVSGKSYPTLSSMSINDTNEFFNSIDLADHELRIATATLREIRRRLQYLCDVGLGYLSLARTASSLSGGEAQRVSLTTSLSSTLVNMLYVLDEPSVGLHPHDVGTLVDAIRNLNERGNTVVAVDHESEMIQNAARVLEIGPGAGVSGGEIVFDGTVAELKKKGNSLTGEYLAGRLGLSSGSNRRRPGRGRLRIVGARGNNLQNLDVQFRLGCMCVVTGVSGSGKSSLVQETLYPAICKSKKLSSASPLPYDELIGDDNFEDVILVDRAPMGRSSRSNPVTYVKAFDDIRKTFAETMDARTRNLKAGHFSFNVEGGRCDKCKGEGQLNIDMQFLADVQVKCDQCRGRRYREHVLSAKYRGKNIAEVLDMTVRQAFGFFRGQPKVQAKLKALIDVGLEYIPLGQPASSLSSGEAQRLKLALYLNSKKSRRTLFLLDEPTTGLHMKDVIRLLDCFEALIGVGHSLIIVEHDLQLIKHADWIIDLGPGAADKGGQVVAVGTPEDIIGCPESLTGRYLKPVLENSVDE